MRQEKIWKIPTSNKPNVLYGRISHTWHENLSSYQVSTFINAFLTCAKICLIFYMASASIKSSNWTEYFLVVKRVVPETRAYFGYIRVFQKKFFFSFPILAFFIVNNMEKYSHTQKISSKCWKKSIPLGDWSFII